jgi:hypothetical protein
MRCSVHEQKQIGVTYTYGDFFVLRGEDGVASAKNYFCGSNRVFSLRCLAKPLKTNEPATPSGLTILKDSRNGNWRDNLRLVERDNNTARVSDG